MILIKKCFYNDFHFVATPLIAYNVGIMRSFPKGNLDGVEGATKWRLERNRIVAVISS